jgi:hypothetical protein
MPEAGSRSKPGFAFQLEKTHQVSRLLVPQGQSTVIALRAVLMRRSANKLLGLGLSFYETDHKMGRIDGKPFMESQSQTPRL